MTRRSIDGFNVNDVGNHAKPEVHGASQRKLAREFPLANLAALRCDLAPTVLISSIALEVVVYW